MPSQAHQADKGLIYIRVTMRVRTGTVANWAVSVANWAVSVANTQRTTMASCALRVDGFNLGDTYVVAYATYTWSKP